MQRRKTQKDERSSKVSFDRGPLGLCLTASDDDDDDDENATCYLQLRTVSKRRVARVERTEKTKLGNFSQLFRRSTRFCRSQAAERVEE